MASSITDERPTIRRVKADDWLIVRDVNVQMLIDAPDAFGEMLSEVQERSPSEWEQFVARCAEGKEMSAFLAEDISLGHTLVMERSAEFNMLVNQFMLMNIL